MRQMSTEGVEYLVLSYYLLTQVIEPGVLNQVALYYPNGPGVCLFWSSHLSFIETAKKSLAFTYSALTRYLASSYPWCLESDRNYYLKKSAVVYNVYVTPSSLNYYSSTFLTTLGPAARPTYLSVCFWAINVTSM